MSELCTDNRFELIEKYKQKLIDATNIETAQDEMAVIDNILFRFWQMGWLDKLDADAEPVKPGRWMPIQKQPYFRKHFTDEVSCSVCHRKGHTAWNYCPNCGAKMDGEREDDDER